MDHWPYIEDALNTYEAGVQRAVAAYERVIDEQGCQDAPTSREVVNAVLLAFFGGEPPR